MEELEPLQKSTHHITNSTTWLLFRLIGGIFLVETAYVALLALSLIPGLTSFHQEVTVGLWVTHTIKFFCLVIIALVTIIPWGTVTYYLTDQHLIKYTGLSRRDESTYDITLLKTVEFHQGWLGRLFNYGDIYLIFASSGYVEKVWLRGIYSPKKYERIFRASLSKRDAGRI